MDVFTAIADPVRRDLLRALSEGSARVVDLAAGRVDQPAGGEQAPAACSRMPASSSPTTSAASATTGPGPRGWRPSPPSSPSSLRRAARPPVTPAVLDALDLEVRRVGRDRRADDGVRPGDPATTATDHATPGETA